MLSVTDAHGLVNQHLGATPRATHTCVVGYFMRKLAKHFSADCALWEVVGLCHDLDYFETAADRTQHGPLAASWLVGRLPEVARQAIAAHDHRTGVQADTLLADALRVADAAAIVDQRLGRGGWRELDSSDPYGSLRRRLGERAYLADILQANARKHAVSFDRIAEIIAAAPPQ
jgi:predicted hydrolase (HD superfamily)